ncbi:hypothetical protein LMG8323_02770 [Ralstonia mannitolilytica]|nr:hypothetical protein LMG8323_02770 [Ralstonia mannitolilytica]
MRLGSSVSFASVSEVPRKFNKKALSAAKQFTESFYQVWYARIALNASHQNSLWQGLPARAALLWCTKTARTLRNHSVIR